MKANILLFAASGLLLAGGATLRAEPGTNACRPSCCSALPTAAGKLSNQSLYQLDSTWTNDSGQAVKLESLRGRPQVVCMFFASCQYACPLLVQQMKQIEADLPEKLRATVGFVLVSFDTERDTPTALHAYRVQHDLAAGRWNLLRGNADDVLELAALLGVKFRKDAQGQFSHSNVLTVLNAEGEIAFQETGLSVPTKRVVERLSQRAVLAPPSS